MHITRVLIEELRAIDRLELDLRNAMGEPRRRTLFKNGGKLGDSDLNAKQFVIDMVRSRIPRTKRKTSKCHRPLIPEKPAARAAFGKLRQPYRRASAFCDR